MTPGREEKEVPPVVVQPDADPGSDLGPQQQSQGRKRKADYSFSMEYDIQWIIMLEVRLIYPKSKAVHAHPLSFSLRATC